MKKTNLIFFLFPVALSMNGHEWMKVCKKESICFKCLKPFVQGHNKVCSVKCGFCVGKSFNNDHCYLQCRFNRNRPDYSSNGQNPTSVISGRKRKSDNSQVDNNLEKLTKIVGDFCKSVAQSSQQKADTHRDSKNKSKGSKKSKN